jgi:hypothetical protein
MAISKQGHAANKLLIPAVRTSGHHARMLLHLKCQVSPCGKGLKEVLRMITVYMHTEFCGARRQPMRERQPCTAPAPAPIPAP